MFPSFQQVIDFLKKLSILIYPEKNNNELIKSLETSVATSGDGAVSGGSTTTVKHESTTAVIDETTVNTEQLPLLVLVNSNSGQGKAEHLWDRAASLLGEAGVTWKTMVTTHKNHARDIIAQADLTKWRGVVVVSGDGLVHEVYNGLYAREDSTTSLGFPVGVVPAGTGNALFMSITHRQEEDSVVLKKEDTAVHEKNTSVPQEENTLASSLTSTGGPKLVSMDLMMVKTDEGDRVGFLSVGWGLISDVDIDSEAIRWAGSLRFTIYGLLHIARKRVYRATLSYIPSHSNSLLAETSSSQISSLADKSSSSPQISTPGDKDQDLLTSCSPISLHTDKDGAWVTETSDYLCIYVMNLPYLDQATKLAPGAQMDDGLLWLVIIRSDCTRAGMLNFMMGMENGTHTDLPGVDYFPVTAASLQPSKEGPQARMTIDGELIPTRSLQVHSLPKAGTIILK